MMKKLVYIISLLYITLGFSSDKILEKSKLEEIIESFILNNPTVIIESLENYRKKAELQIEGEVKENIKAFYKNKVYENFPFIGQKETDIIIVEFIDYNCGYCKKTLNTVRELHKNIDNIRIVFIDFPILSENSRMAAKASLASNNQNSYFKYHSELLKHPGPLTKEVLLKLAEKLSLNIKKFEQDMESEDIKNRIEQNISLAENFNIRGTPTFLLGNRILAGAHDYKRLKNIIYNRKKED